VTVHVAGFERKSTIHVAPALFRVQALAGGWSEDEIRLWVKEKVFGFMRERYSIDALPQLGDVIEVPSDILFAGYKRKD